VDAEPCGDVVGAHRVRLGAREEHDVAQLWSGNCFERVH
jgi:hypothetical protein